MLKDIERRHTELPPPARPLISPLMRYRQWALLLALAMFAVAFPISVHVDFDRTVTAMFDPNDADLAAYQDLQRRFGGNAVVMIVYHDEDLWTNQGLKRSALMTETVSQIAGVSGVLSPAVLNEAVKKIRPASFLSSNQPLVNRQDPVAIGFNKMFAGYTHSSDLRHGAVVAILEPGQARQAIGQMRQLVDRWNQSPSDENLSSSKTKTANRNQALVDGISKVALVGEPVLIEEAFELIERDGSWLATLTIVLLSIVVWLSLLDLRFVCLSISVIGFGVTLTKAMMWGFGIELSLVSTILTAIVTVITVTAVLHLGVRFRIVRRRNGTAARAMVTAFSWLLIPIAMTCATDAAGFAALGVSKIRPVGQFGWMIAIASAAVFVGLLLIGPAVLTMPSPKWLSGMAGSFRRRWLEPFQRATSRWSLILAKTAIGSPGILATLVVMMGLFILLGWRRLETETSFLNNFRPTSPIVTSYDRVETQFGGAGVWDVMLDAPDEIDQAYLQRVSDLQAQLRAIDVNGVRLTKVISLADADAVTRKARLLRWVSPSRRLEGMRLTMPEFYDALLTSPSAAATNEGLEPVQGGRRMRLMLRSRENIKASDKVLLIEAVRRVLASSQVGKSNGQVTGYYVLMARLIDQLIDDGWRCFGASGVLVWILLVVSGRSAGRASVALVVNLLPAMLVISAMGWVGGKINMGSAMIAAVSIGLSIDGSIHFLASYRRKLAFGHSPTQSAAHAASRIGVPMIFATLALALGFGGLATSQFIPTATFGILVAMTLVVGTVVNLTLLPSFICWFERSPVTPSKV